VAGAAVALLAAGAATAAAAGVFAGPRDFVVGSGEVAAGGVMPVKGLGCTAGATVAISFDGKPLGTLTADDAGVFWGNFTVPADAALGQHDVAAVCDPSGTGKPAQRTTVMVAIPVPPSPPAPEFVIGGAAVIGGQFAVKGAGCAASAIVTISVDGVTAGTAVADDLGLYTAVVSLPAGVPVGAHDASAVCAGRTGTNLTLTTSLPVVPPEEAGSTKPTPVR
jgi:hypothetical protein